MLYKCYIKWILQHPVQILFSKTKSGWIEYGSKSESSNKGFKDTKNGLRQL